MEILQLTYFCDAAQTENFSATAKRFGVPPSDISQSIKRLERELGAELFFRRANRISLNPNGEAFFEKAREALALLEDARRQMTENSNRGFLTICVNTNRRIVMQTVEKFRNLYPNVDMAVECDVEIGTEAFDLIIANEVPIESFYRSEKILTEDFCLAVSASSSLVSKETVTTDDLREQAFITMNKSSSFYRMTHRICVALGFSPRIAIQSDDPFYVRKCVELGLGIAFVPTVSWRGLLSENIVLKHVGHFPRDTYVLRDIRRRLSLPAANFMKMLAAECEVELHAHTAI